MKKKLVFWGKDPKEERVLLALSLNAKEGKYDLWSFDEHAATEEFVNKMMGDWRDGKEVEFPENNTHYDMELTMSSDMLPEGFTVDKEDLLRRAQTEWQFICMSAKLHNLYVSELEELKEKVAGMSDYDQKIWEELKGFWSKVQVQVREKNLFREHANYLRDNTNQLFAKLKELRRSLDDEFKEKSKENKARFMQILDEIEAKIEEGLGLQPIFNELKNIQRDFKDTKFSRDDRSKVWDRLDKAFKNVKKNRFGDSAVSGSSPIDRLTRRYDGLLKAIEKMERSIHRDEKDLEFQDRRIEGANNQLEAQIRQAKTKMIQERIRSKKVKFDEMLATKSELERKMDVERQREAQRKEKEKIKEAKSVIEDKIAQEIKDKTAISEEQAEQLKEVAEEVKQIKEDKPKTTDTKAEDPQPEESKEEEPKTEEAEAEKEAETQKEDEESKMEEIKEAVEEIGEKAESAIEDAIDTVKAVASVIGDKLEEVVEDLKSKDEEE